MNKRSISRKQVVSALLVVAVIIGLMLTMHILVNNFDLFNFIKSIHGG